MEILLKTIILMSQNTALASNVQTKKKVFLLFKRHSKKNEAKNYYHLKLFGINTH